VGFGNNFPLVKGLLKNRWWMSNGEKASFEECQLIWTSWKKQKIINQLKKAEDSPKETSRRLYARMEDNFHLTNKKGLLANF
jgi:hypothetical protein